MEKTAVEFIFDAVYRDIPFSELLGIIVQAKGMEKQQIIDAYEDGYEDGYSDSDNNIRLNKDYYNQNFKK
jgi:hypothetical protein